MRTYIYRASNLKSTITFLWPQFHGGNHFMAPAKNRHFLQFIHNNNQRECGSTLYVGLARTVPPTNTNFWLTFLLT